MKLNKLSFSILISVLLVSCSGGGGGGSSSSTTTLSSIAVTPEDQSIAANNTLDFTATGKYSDGTNTIITSSVTWSSSNTTVATINTAGMAAGVSAGTTTIKATSGSVSGSTTLTVTAPTLNSIEIAPATQAINLGATQQFTATGSYSNSTTKDITTSVTWSSSDTTVATISNVSGSNGFAASLAAGAANITATLNGISQNAQLTVNSTPTDNAVQITVNGSLCLPSSVGYPNKPCVSVTVCYPGSTTNCQTINDILLDTMSYGLRIFRTFQTSTGTDTLLTLPQVSSGSGSLAECAQFGSGNTWGPIQTADVWLGNELASNIPIQVTDSGFSTIPSQSACSSSVYTGFADAEFNGILGIGVSKEDCGSDCVSDSTGGYYSCNGSTCSPATASLANQVQNPVSFLTNDNNGVIVRLPAVAANGATSADGVLILGIGTRSNNTVAGITASFSTDSYGDFTSAYSYTSNGRQYSYSYTDGFMDTGSNGLFFYSALHTIATCSGWYCPDSAQTLSATMAGYPVSFTIGDATTFLSSSNNVFPELGGTNTSSDIPPDWGLPFFLGRSVYIVIEGNTVSGLGTGPYLAY